MTNLIARRPAEISTAVAAAVAFLLSRAFGWDESVTAALTIVVGAIPTAVTWVVSTVRNEHGQVSPWLVLVVVLVILIALRVFGII